MKRKQFLKQSSLVVGGVLMSPTHAIASSLLDPDTPNKFVSKRPPISERTFISKEVELAIKQTRSIIKDDELGWMFENCYPNTLDTTVDYEIINGKPDTFIITGDIDAMWLRDSTAQVWPYMPLIDKDPKIKNLILGLINRQVKCVLTDPYANAFFKDLTRISKWSSDVPTPKPGVHERKWEIDSLCYFVRLSYHYYKISGDTSFMDEDWDKAVRLVVDTFRTEQRKDGNSSPYSFSRTHSVVVGLAPFDGGGAPTKTTGMIHSIFRPSDDGTIFPYLVPSNIFACHQLTLLIGSYTLIIVFWSNKTDIPFVSPSSRAFSYSIKNYSDIIDFALKTKTIIYQTNRRSIIYFVASFEI